MNLCVHPPRLLVDLIVRLLEELEYPVLAPADHRVAASDLERAVYEHRQHLWVGLKGKMYLHLHNGVPVPDPPVRSFQVGTRG